MIRTEALLREIATDIDKKLGNEIERIHGFILLTFEFNKPGISNYISNADRESMVEALREAASRIEKNQDMPPVHSTIQ